MKCTISCTVLYAWYHYFAVCQPEIRGNVVLGLVENIRFSSLVSIASIFWWMRWSGTGLTSLRATCSARPVLELSFRWKKDKEYC